MVDLERVFRQGRVIQQLPPNQKEGFEATSTILSYRYPLLKLWTHCYGLMLPNHCMKGVFVYPSTSASSLTSLCIKRCDFSSYPTYVFIYDMLSFLLICKSASNYLKNKKVKINFYPCSRVVCASLYSFILGGSWRRCDGCSRWISKEPRNF